MTILLGLVLFVGGIWANVTSKCKEDVAIFSLVTMLGAYLVLRHL